MSKNSILRNMVSLMTACHYDVRTFTVTFTLSSKCMLTYSLLINSNSHIQLSLCTMPRNLVESLRTVWSTSTFRWIRRAAGMRPETVTLIRRTLEVYQAPFRFLLSVGAEGSQLSGGVGRAWGESRETSRLAGLTHLRKPSRACSTQSVP